MAARNVDITAAPSNIVSGHSLSVGVSYTLQNVDANSRIFVREAVVAPSGGALRGFVLVPLAHATIKPESGVGIWVWCDRADGAKAVLDEAP